MATEARRPRMKRTPEDLTEALRRHLRLLHQFCERAFEAGDHDYLGEVAGKIRLLAIREGRNRPLLLDLMDHYSIGGTTIVARAIRLREDGPKIGDQITLSEYFDLPAYCVQKQVVSKRTLISIWAAQHGAAHEDWRLDESFALVRKVVDPAGRLALSLELETTARSVLKLGEQVLQEIDRIRGQNQGPAGPTL